MQYFFYGRNSLNMLERLNAKKFASHTSQRLKGLIVEYDVLCLPKGWDSLRINSLEENKEDYVNVKKSDEGFLNLNSDRSLISKSQLLKETLKRFPDFVQSKILESISHEPTTISKADEVLSNQSSDRIDNQLRKKYMDRLHQLKEKHKVKNNDQQTTSALVPGASLLMSYVASRGIYTAMLPSQSNVDKMEVNDVLKTMEKYLDVFLSNQENIATASLIQESCQKWNFLPKDVMVLGSSKEVLDAASKVGCITCHSQVISGPITSVRPLYTIKSLRRFRDIVEDLNGISYR